MNRNEFEKVWQDWEKDSEAVVQETTHGFLKGSDFRTLIEYLEDQIKDIAFEFYEKGYKDATNATKRNADRQVRK